MKKIFEIFKLGFRKTYMYRFDFFAMYLGIIAPTIINFFVWNTIFSENNQETMYTYSYYQMIAYTIMSGILSVATEASFKYSVVEDIRLGTLSNYIVKPINYLKYQYIINLSTRIIPIATSFFMALLLIEILNTKQKVFNFVFFVFSTIGAIFLNYLFYSIISVIGFWTVKLNYFISTIGMAINILCGGLIPIEVFGKTFIKIMRYLPFEYIVYFPANIILGRLNIEETFFGCIIQVIWIFVFTFITNVIWKKGISKFQAVGN